MTTESIRTIYHKTQKQLSEELNIPLGTIKNWDARNCMPQWAHDLIFDHYYMVEEVEHQKKMADQFYKAMLRYHGIEG